MTIPVTNKVTNLDPAGVMCVANTNLAKLSVCSGVGEEDADSNGPCSGP